MRSATYEHIGHVFSVFSLFWVCFLLGVFMSVFRVLVHFVQQCDAPQCHPAVDLFECARIPTHLQWHLVASALGTKFTALDCLKRYQQVLRPRAWMRQGGTSIWTPERDRALANAVAKYGAGKWQAISGELGCAPSTAMYRWRAVVQPSLKEGSRKGPWSPEEDAKLNAAIALFGQRWFLVATMVPGRTDTQCRERYCNVLDPSLKYASTTACAIGVCLLFMDAAHHNHYDACLFS